MDPFEKGVDPVWGEVLCLGERFQIQALTSQNEWPPGLSILPGFTRSLHLWAGTAPAACEGLFLWRGADEGSDCLSYSCL